MTTERVERTSDATAVPRRIAILRRETPARLLDDRQELVTTAPHLLLRELILIELGLIVLALSSLFLDAPLEGIADPLHTPNPAKAPWYFVGLQELLHYFPPVVAGVLIPALVVVAIAVIPYFRINEEVVGLYERPWKRRLLLITLGTAAVSALLVAYQVWAVLVPTVLVYFLIALPALQLPGSRLRRRLEAVALADWLMVWFVAVAVVLTLIGLLFRGPGWSFTLPWRDGIF